MVMPQFQTISDGGRKSAEVFPGALANRFESFKPGGLLHRVDAHAFGGAVIDGGKNGDVSFRLRKRSGSIRAPHLIGRRGHDRPLVRAGRESEPPELWRWAPGTIAELQVWRMMLPKQTPDAYLFPTERNTPLRRDNVWNRSMLPNLKTVGLEWATFQVLRRTNASLSRIARIDDKVAADQRGQGLGISLEVYSISDLQQKIEAVKRLESEVIQ